MAYPRKIKNAARTLWLLGYSDRKVCEQLAKRFPNEKVPREPRTIFAWRKTEEWAKDLPEITAKLHQNHIQKMVDDLRQEEIEDIETLQVVIGHIRSQLSVRDDKNVLIPVSMKDANLAALALDKLMRRKRINRHGFDIISPEGIKNATARGMARSPDLSDTDQ